MAEQARGSMLMSQFGTGAAQANEAIAVADAVSARAVAAHARCTLAVCTGAEGRIDEGIELVRAALEVAEDLVLPEDLNRAYGNLSHLLLSADRLEEAAAIAFDAQAMGEEIGGVRMSSAASNSIEALTRLGRWDDAETALDRLGLAPFGSCAAGPFVGRLPLALSRGMLDEADELLQTAHELADGMGDVQTSALVCALHAQLEIERANPERAVQLRAKLCNLSRTARRTISCRGSATSAFRPAQTAATPPGVAPWPMPKTRDATHASFSTLLRLPSSGYGHGHRRFRLTQRH